MLNPGDKVCFKCDPKREVFTVRSQSLHVAMTELEEFDGWSWTESLVLADPDPLADSLAFLGL